MKDRETLLGLSGQYDGLSDYKLFELTQDWETRDWISVGLARIVKSAPDYGNLNDDTKKLIKRRREDGNEFLEACLKLSFDDLDKLMDYHAVLNNQPQYRTRK